MNCLRLFNDYDIELLFQGFVLLIAVRNMLHLCLMNFSETINRPCLAYNSLTRLYMLMIIYSCEP